MDWHFQEKKRASNSTVQSRSWFATAAAWVSSKGAEEAEPPPPAFFKTEEEGALAEVVSRVPVDDEQPTCPLCGDEFDVDFDDDTEEWMCVSAMVAQVRDIQAAVTLNKIVHTKCYTPGTVPVLAPSGPPSPDLGGIQPKRALEPSDDLSELPEVKRVKVEQEHQTVVIKQELE
eukprot:TRINITY_DN27911_c0_g1_i2.p1 TRINITY_DN27911_c0_g1~~TRINITY_DN27911_c0_g1_i2.p1  ORF type:complete len:174 (+),score=41.24 TRINITY_DN27911_c0_g1_i2:236-757(+)